MAQWLERSASDQEVRRSNPAGGSATSSVVENCSMCSKVWVQCYTEIKCSITHGLLVPADARRFHRST